MKGPIHGTQISLNLFVLQIINDSIFLILNMIEMPNHNTYCSSDLLLNILTQKTFLIKNKLKLNLFGFLKLYFIFLL